MAPSSLRTFAVVDGSCQTCYISTFPFLVSSTSQSLWMQIRNLETWPQLTRLATGSSSPAFVGGPRAIRNGDSPSRNALVPTGDSKASCQPQKAYKNRDTQCQRGFPKVRFRSQGPGYMLGILRAFVGTWSQLTCPKCPSSRRAHQATIPGGKKKQGRSRRNPARCNHANLLDWTLSRLRALISPLEMG